MSVRVGTTDRAITAFGGAELLREAGAVIALAEQLDDCLKMGRHLPASPESGGANGTSKTWPSTSATISQCAGSFAG